MPVLWKKIWFDLWHQKSRTLLAILSIAAGLFSIGAIFGMVDQLLTGMDQAHIEVKPSHINIILRNYITEEVVSTLEEIDGVEKIDPVNQISIRYKAQPDADWELGTLVQRKDFEDQIYDLMILKAGSWPTDNKLGIERLSSQYFGPEINDTITIQVQGEEEEFTISSLVRHPFVQPPLFGGQAHFFTDAEGLSSFGVPNGYYGQLLVRVTPYSEDRAKEIAGEIRSELSNLGYGVIANLFQEPDEHWGRMFVEGINLVLQIMAVVSLFLSVVLVLNTFTALITQQTNQIGVIKAIGGKRQRIIRMYLISVMAYAGTALLLALPTSAVFSFLMSRWFLNLFNIDYEVFQVSTNAIVIQALSAIIVPLLAVLWPVLKGTSITVREAIASYGLGADYHQNFIDRFIEKIGSLILPTIYAASLGNLFRRKGRLILTLTALVTAGIMFLVVMSLISSTNLTLDNEMARQQYDVRIGFSEGQDIAEVLFLTDQLSKVQSSEMWYSRNATLLREGEKLQDSAGLGAQLIGLPANTNMYQPIIVSGRWLERGDKNQIIISQETADSNQLSVGDIVTIDLGDLGAAKWEIAGLYRVIYGSGYVVEPIYAPLETVASVTGQTGIGTQVLVNALIDNYEEEKVFSNGLQTLYEYAGFKIDFYTTTARLEQREFANNQFNSIISVLLSLAMLTATVGGIGLAGSLGISVIERTREIGVLRSIGARTKTIKRMFIMEGVLQGLISFLISTPLAFILARPLARALGQTMLEVDLDYAFNNLAVGIWLMIVLIISIIASIAPARRATKINVNEVLNY